MPGQNDYILRGSQNLSVPRVHTTTCGLRNIRYEGARLWNSLPENLKTAYSVLDFRSMINTWNGPTCGCNIMYISTSAYKNGTEKKRYHDQTSNPGGGGYLVVETTLLT